MAYTPEQWLKAKGLFEIGYSPEQISQELNFKSRDTVYKRAVKEKWEKNKILQEKTELLDLEKKNYTIQQENSTMVEKISTLEDYQIIILKELVEDITKQKSIIFNGLNLAAIRANQKLQQNRKKELLKIKEGFGNGVSQEHYEEIESDLSSSDIQDYTNILIKAGQGLGIIEKDGSQVSIQNNIQNNNATLTLEQAEKEALALGVPLEVLVR